MLLSPNVFNIERKSKGIHDRDIFAIKTSFKASCHDLFARAGAFKVLRDFFIRTRSFLGVMIHFGCTLVVSRTIARLFLASKMMNISMVIRIRE